MQSPEFPEPLTRRQRIALWAAAAIAFLSRFAALSKGPWDWDEVLFCLAVQDFDVAQHQPHPPGFPLHVFLGKVFVLFTSSEFTALQAVNLVAGASVFPVLFLLARALRFDFAGAFGAAIAFTFLPNVWFYGGTAFSDVPGMVLYLAAAALWLGPSRRSRYVAGALLAAAGILVRPHGALVLLFPWSSATWRLLRERRFRDLALGAFAGAAAVVLGYGIAVLDTGPAKYAHSLAKHAEYVAAWDSFSAETRPSLNQSVRALLDPYDAGKVSLLVNALAAAGIVFGRARAARILLTFLPQFVFVVFAMNPLGSSRFSLAYIAGVILLATEGAIAIARRVPRYELAVRTAILAVVVGRLVTWVLPAFETPRRTDPPPVAVVKWVRDQTSQETPVVFEHGLTPWVRYYLAGRETIHADEWTAGARHPRLHEAWYAGPGTSEAEGAIVFARPRNRTWNIVTRRNFEASAVPLERVVRFGAGWHGQESDGASTWRWAARRSTMLLSQMQGEREVTLNLHLPLEALRTPVTLRFFLNGALVHTQQLADAEATIRLRITPEEQRPNELVVEASDAFVPKERGGSDDSRELAWMLRSWNCRLLP